MSSDTKEGNGYLIVSTGNDPRYRYYAITEDRLFTFVEEPSEATVLPNLEVAKWEAKQFACPTCKELEVRIIPYDGTASAEERMKARHAFFGGEGEIPPPPELTEEMIRELQSCLSYVIDVTPVIRWKEIVERGWDYGVDINISGDDGAGMVWHLDRMMKILGVDESNNFMFWD